MSPAFRGVALFVLSRHRLLLGAVAVIYVVTFASFDTLWALEGKPLVVPMLTFLRGAPFFLPLLLFVTAASVFTIDLASRESAFPRHFFTLPVGSAQLALPFVAYAVLFWGIGWALAIGITDGRVLLAGPLQFPPEMLRSETWFPFLELSFLVWSQALMWTPFRRRGSRVGFVVAAVVAHFAGLVVGIRQTLLPGDLATLCVLGSLGAGGVAVCGVARARRGDPSAAASASDETAHADETIAANIAPTTGSHGAVRTAPDARDEARNRRRPIAFRSGIDAQVWYEWHLHGFSRWFFLSTIVALLVLVPMLLAPRREVMSAGAMAATAAGLLFMALVFVPSFGPLFANFVSNRYKAFTMPSFFAALPLSSGDFAWAKMRAAARSVALMCVVIAALIALGAAFVDGAWPTALAAALRTRYGAFEGTLLVAFAAGALPLLAIAATMNTVWLALTDRRAFWHAFNALLIAIVIGWLFAVRWMQQYPDWPLRAAEALPEIMAAVATLKVVALAVLIQRVGSGRLYPWSRICLIGGAWLAALVAAIAVCLRYVPGADRHPIAAIATLVAVVPVLGIMGAPLALQLNRCR
jgi:hypothetical protein